MRTLSTFKTMANSYQPDKMRFKSHQARIRFALSKAYGMGKDDPWSNKEIAEYLNVSTDTVKKYLDSPYGQETRDALEKVAEETRLDQVRVLNDKLDTLAYLEEQLMRSVEVIVTEYDFKYIVSELAEATFSDGTSYKVNEAGEVELPIPVPMGLAQVPQFDRLKEVWKEQRLTYEQLNKLLGLESPERIEVSGTQERKVWVGLEDDGLPEATVSKLGDEEK